MELKTFQQKASTTIFERYQEFKEHDNRPGTKKRESPFFQSLAAITGSGKTPILAQTISQIDLLFKDIKPIILWMSKSKVVVEQTYNNFIKGGKYSNFIDDFDIVNIKNLNYDLLNSNKSLIIVLTTASFNNKDQEEGNLNLFKINQDRFGNSSPWEAIKNRLYNNNKRPLFIVYDEGHNLTEQQTGLLEELEPEAYLVSSATLKFPSDFIRDVINPYHIWANKNNKKDYDRVLVNTMDVVEEQLIKKNIVFDGTTATMEFCIFNMYQQLKFLSTQATDINIKPKAIYVCNTNIKDGGETDNNRNPFNLRQAPPIKIWRYLVEELKINPEKIAVYTSELKISDKPTNFNLFGSMDDDFLKFTNGNYEHIIFNQSLQEGWDDPECYLCYIDKSIKSSIKISQIIGRVLRQPNVTHYTKDGLNTAHFYIRVDDKETFSNAIKEVQDSLGSVLPPSEEYFNEKNPSFIELNPLREATIGTVGINLEYVKDPVNSLIKDLTNYDEKDQSTISYAEEFSKKIDLSNSENIIIDSPYDIIKNNKMNTRRVKLNWLISLRFREKSSRLLNLTKTNSEEFFKTVSFGSMIDKVITAKASEAFQIYQDKSILEYTEEDQYVFETIRVNENKLITFNNSIYSGYSGLNPFEIIFAKHLDNTNYIWHRNSSTQAGYNIPLMDGGITKNFYTDFLVWKDNLIFSLDTKGNHLLDDAIKRKLFEIKEGHTIKIVTRFISKGKQESKNHKPSSNGYTVWIFKENREIAIPCDNLSDVIEHCLRY